MCFCIIMLLRPLSTLVMSCNFMTGNWSVYNTVAGSRPARRSWHIATAGICSLFGGGGWGVQRGSAAVVMLKVALNMHLCRVLFFFRLRTSIQGKFHRVSLRGNYEQSTFVLLPLGDVQAYADVFLFSTDIFPSTHEHLTHCSSPHSTTTNTQSGTRYMVKRNTPHTNEEAR